MRWIALMTLTLGTAACGNQVIGDPHRAAVVSAATDCNRMVGTKYAACAQIEGLELASVKASFTVASRVTGSKYSVQGAIHVE